MFFNYGTHGRHDDKVLERLWVPHSRDPYVGIVYIVTEGDEASFAPNLYNFDKLKQPIIDARFMHTSPNVSWWNPKKDPKVVFGSATIDHPLKFPDALFEYEFVISNNNGKIFYEQRTLPLRKKLKESYIH